MAQIISHVRILNHQLISNKSLSLILIDYALSTCYPLLQVLMKRYCGHSASPLYHFTGYLSHYHLLQFTSKQLQHG